ncbi:hypothetical protein Mapa_011950 [Marchantia paleacea]|nr:hypothetical protein Mapa_011950 [Marchantia paleacea]
MQNRSITSTTERMRSFQASYNLSHRWPVFAFEPNALLGDLGHDLHGCVLGLFGYAHSLIEDTQQLVCSDRGHGVVHHVHIRRADHAEPRRQRNTPVDGLLARQELHEHHPEAVHVALCGQMLSGRQMRVLLGWRDERKTEI